MLHFDIYASVKYYNIYKKMKPSPLDISAGLRKKMLNICPYEWIETLKSIEIKEQRLGYGRFISYLNINPKLLKLLAIVRTQGLLFIFFKLKTIKSHIIRNVSPIPGILFLQQIFICLMKYCVPGSSLVLCFKISCNSSASDEPAPNQQVIL